MQTVLIDADVILDLFIQREPHHSVSLRLFSYLDQKPDTLQGVTSPVIIANVAYILGKLKSQAYAVQKIQELRQIIEVAPVTQATIDLALSSPYKDFEDAIQYYCAKTNDIPVIITRNVGDFPSGEVLIVTPQEFITMGSRSGPENSPGQD